MSERGNGSQNSSRGRVLLVEDEMLVSMLIEDMLDELGYEITGPVARLENAVSAAQEEQLVAAVLDLNLNGRNTYSVAETLQKRGIPFIFATGYGVSVLSERFQHVPTLQKPFQLVDLSRALDSVMRRETAAG